MKKKLLFLLVFILLLIPINSLALSKNYTDKVSKRGELRIDDSFLKNIAVDGNIYVTHKDNKVEIHGKKR